MVTKYKCKSDDDAGYGTVQDVTDNLVVIDILFSSTQETEITELVSYGWGNFLGELNMVQSCF